MKTGPTIRALRNTILMLLLASCGAWASAATLAIPSSTLVAGTVGSPYDQVLAATGGTQPYTWTLGGSLPPGLSLSTLGQISGTPTTSSVTPYTFGITVKDAAGNSAFATMSILVNPKPLAITTTSPLTAGIAGVEYPHKILAATGGTSPYTFALTGGSLPPGMTLTSGTIEGTPTLSGTYQISVTVTDSAGSKAFTELSITIKPSATDLVISSGSVSFSLSVGAGAPPSAQVVEVQSSVVSQQLSYAVSVSPAVNWLNVTGGNTTPATLSFFLTSAALALTPGSYTTTVSLLCGSLGCPGIPLQVPVTLTVNPAPAQLKILNDVIAFTTDPSNPTAALTAQLQIRNSGGLPLTVTSVNCHATWCTPGAFPSSISGGVIVPVTITATPGTLSAGTHLTTVTVATNAGTISTPVTLLVLQKASLGMPTAGAQFTAPAGGALAKTTESFAITATGGSYSWTATASSTPAWLVVNTPTGTASPGQPATVQYSLNTSVVAGLAAKTYYGAIVLTSSGITNSPQEFRVILTVTQPTDPIRPQVSPAGLVLTPSAGLKAFGTVSVLAPSATSVGWQAAAQTVSGGSWLSVSPGTGNASAASPGSTTVTANPAGLAPGVYNGTVSYAFAGAAIRSVNVTLVVPAATAQGSISSHANDTPAHCTPSQVAIAQTGLVNNFSAPASWPVPVSINLLDDCGNPVSSGQVVATFTDGDPPIALPLANAATGLYASTWTPSHTTAQVTINTTAEVTGFATATAQLVGEVVPNSEPSLNAHAILNVFNPLLGDALAPGEAVAMYGANLASIATQPPNVPLPTSVNGTQVFIGGIAAPIYYSSPAQMNVQIPFELDPTLQYQVVISANGALTTPQAIALAPAKPGVAQNADSTILAEHATTGALISMTSPAKPLEYIVAFAAGMGGTTANVPSGSGAPASPLAYTSPLPVATFDGNPIPIAFAGLSPGQVGLYQMNIQIPAGTSNGNHTLVISQSGGAVSSNSTLVPVHN